MHSYQHNIKTFNNATRHLTRVERALYRDLIELYYDREQPLTADQNRLERLVLVNTEEEKKALNYVLDEFFELTGDVYSHDFCDSVIEEYQSNHSKKCKAGRASALARKKKAEERKKKRSTKTKQNSTGVEQVLNGCATNQKPETRNQKPLKDNAYAFCGEKIKLNSKDYDDMKNKYTHINLDQELSQLDLELRDKKAWWGEMNKKLYYRNLDEGRRNERHKRYGSQRKQTPADRAFDQGQLAIAKAEAAEQQADQASYSPMGENVAAVPVSLGILGRADS